MFYRIKKRKLVNSYFMLCVLLLYGHPNNKHFLTSSTKMLKHLKENFARKWGLQGTMFLKSDIHV